MPSQGQGQAYGHGSSKGPDQTWAEPSVGRGNIMGAEPGPWAESAGNVDTLEVWAGVWAEPKGHGNIGAGQGHGAWSGHGRAKQGKVRLEGQDQARGRAWPWVGLNSSCGKTLGWGRAHGRSHRGVVRPQGRSQTGSESGPWAELREAPKGSIRPGPSSC